MHYERTKNKFNDFRSRNSVFFFKFISKRMEMWRVIIHHSYRSNYQTWQQFITIWHLIHIDVVKLRRKENFISKLTKNNLKMLNLWNSPWLDILNNPWKQMFMEFLSNIPIKNSEGIFFQRNYSPFGIC